MTWGTQDLEGEMGREIEGGFRWEGMWVNLRLILVDAQQGTTQFCKANILNLKSKVEKIKR